MGIYTQNLYWHPSTVLYKSSNDFLRATFSERTDFAAQNTYRLSPIFFHANVLFMKKFPIIYALCFMLYALCGAPAHAYEYNHGGYGFKLNGEGMLGGAAVLDKDLRAISDFRIRAQGNYAVTNGITVGAVYAIDQLSLDHDKWARDAFLFTESPWGRVEAGFTDSIAAKMGVALPDVGGLRINDYPIIYNFANPGVPVISNPTISDARYNFRVNIASVPTNPLQFGASFAPGTRNFNSASDISVKYRQPNGKTKTSLVLGASFIDSPENMQADFYAPNVTADFRAQVATGLNVQYNSWIWGLNARAIYDQDAISTPSDGLRLGTGVSYDLLSYTASASYIFSDIGIWDHHDSRPGLRRGDKPPTPDSRIAHTGVLSLRYKINENFDVWASWGLTASAVETNPFVALGLRGKF